MNGTLQRWSGGAEMQMAMLGQGLAERGIRVSYLVCRSDAPRVQQLNDGITLVGTYRRYGGLPGIRYFSNTLPGMLTGMRLADASIYYVRGASGLAGVVAAFAQARRRAFIFAVSSDRDVQRASLKRLLKPRDWGLFRLGIHWADTIIVQTRTQQANLYDAFRREGLWIPSICDSPTEETAVGAGETVLWAGRSRALKRPFMFLELARLLPQYQFVMAMSDNKAEQQLSDQVLREADELPNLQLLRDVPYTEMAALFDTAAVVVNTSEYEGFPNTFLQAWARGRPVVATVDPDELLSRDGLGIYACDLPGLVEAVSTLLVSPQHRCEIGIRARALICKRHNREVVLDAYTKLISRLAQNHGISSIRGRYG